MSTNSCKRTLITSLALFITVLFQHSSSQLIQGSVQWVSLEEGQSYTLNEVLHQSQPTFDITGKQDGYQLSFDLAGFWKQNKIQAGNMYAILNIPGWESQNEVGKPAVPMKPVFVELPAGAKYSVTVSQLKDVEISLSTVWPTQPAVPQDDPPPPFVSDRNTYGTNAFFPGNPIISTHEINMRNHKILEVQVAPVRYNPFTGIARASQRLIIDIKLDKISSKPSELSNSIFETSMIKGLPSVIKSSTQSPDTDPPKYMVLMDDQFESNSKLTEFLEWKRRKGNDVVIVKTSDINSNGSPSANQIISYMRNLPDKDYPVYLLIIGMDNQSSGVRPFMYDGKTPSDLDFACRDDSDFLPDLFNARLPAKDNSELTNMLEKVMDMDRTPPTSDMYQKVVMAGQIQDNEGAKNQCDRMHCETSDAIATYFEQDAGGVDYTCVRAITNPHGANADCLWRNDSRSMLWRNVSGEQRKIGRRVYDHFVGNSTARSRINDAVNAGVALVQHRDHGNVTGWGNPSYRSSNVRSSIKNGKNRPMVWSNNCLSGSYHKNDSFIKAWMTHSEGGAYAYVGCTNVSSWGWNDYVCHGKFIAFLGDWRSWHSSSTTPDWTSDLPEPDFGGEGVTNRLGPILNFAKLYMYQRYGSSSTCERHANLFHLFGCPEAFIQMLTPKTLNVTFRDTVPEQASTMEVECGQDNAFVCLYGPQVGVHQVSKTTNGKVSFTIDPTGEGELFVTVTGYGIRPFEGKALVRNIPIGISKGLVSLKKLINQITIKRGAQGFTIHIPAQEKCRVSLFDLRGRQRSVIDVAEGNAVYQVPYGEISSGIFVVNIDRGEQSIRKRIVVQ